MKLLLGLGEPLVGRSALRRAAPALTELTISPTRLRVLRAGKPFPGYVDYQGFAPRAARGRRDVTDGGRAAGCSRVSLPRRSSSWTRRLGLSPRDAARVRLFAKLEARNPAVSVKTDPGAHAVMRPSASGACGRASRAAALLDSSSATLASPTRCSARRLGSRHARRARQTRAASGSTASARTAPS